MRLFGFLKTDLAQVMALTGVICPEKDENLAHVLHKAWLRPTGKERWELAPLHENKREQLLPIFNRMGLVDVLKPECLSYDYILFMGGALCRMVLRAQTLRSLLAAEIVYKDIVYLSGKRLLTDDEKIYLKKRKNIRNVSMEDHLYPDFFQSEGISPKKILSVVTSERIHADGTRCRPTTADTVREWLTTNPTPGHVLAISSQPLCLYQKTVLELLLPQDFVVGVVGNQASIDTPIAFYLDTIARIAGVIEKNKKGELI